MLDSLALACHQPFGEVQGETTVGADQACDMTLSGSNIEPEHARIFPRSGRLFCRALTGDPDDFKGATRTWILPDTELRPGVDYMLAPGTQMAFGEPDGEPVTIQFEESNAGAPCALLHGLQSSVGVLLALQHGTDSPSGSAGTGFFF